MSEHDDKKQPEERPRRPYEPPAVITEQVFETQAASCASGVQQPLCGPGRS